MKCGKCGATTMPEGDQVEKILEEVSEEHMVPVNIIRGPTRKIYAVMARNCASLRIREEMGLPYKTIGFHLGGRDHSTIMHGITQALLTRKEEEE